MTTTMSNYELYGGAITVNLPANLIDASDMRQVPDAQEVFLDRNSDMSIIFEILDRVEPADLDEAARFHFDSIAHDSSAQSSTVDDVRIPDEQRQAPPHTPKPILLEGVQQVAKFNRTQLDNVKIFLALYRLTELPHDIVFVLNVPLTASTNTQFLQLIRSMFADAASSLVIEDFALFGTT